MWPQCTQRRRSVWYCAVLYYNSASLQVHFIVNLYSKYITVCCAVLYYKYITVWCAVLYYNNASLQVHFIVNLLYSKYITVWCAVLYYNNASLQVHFSRNFVKFGHAYRHVAFSFYCGSVITGTLLTLGQRGAL